MQAGIYEAKVPKVITEHKKTPARVVPQSGTGGQ